MIVNFNGSALETEQKYLHDLLQENGFGDKTGIAVAVNQSVVPKMNWNQTELKNNDDILIITATQGG